MESGQYGEAGGPGPSLVDLTDDSSSGDPPQNDSLLENSNVSNITNLNNISSVVNNISSNKNAESGQEIGREDKRVINYNLKYRNTDKGPFCIYVEHQDLNVGQLHPMRVGSILNKLPNNLQAEIIEVVSVGRSRIKIYVKSAASANFLIKHAVFSQNNLISYVPQHLVERKALVRNVDTSLTVQQLLEKVVSSVRVTDIKRLTRMITNEKGERVSVPRQLIIVTFEGLVIPDYIFIDYVRCPVELYVSPVIQCFSCLRFGHSSKLCRGKKRCKICSDEHDGDCVKPAYCMYCKVSTHNSTSKSCPKYIQQKNIKQIMASKNVSFKEAEKFATNPSLFSTVLKSNPYGPLSVLNSDNEFPILRSPQNSGTTNFIQPSSANHSPNFSKKRKTHAKGHGQPENVRKILRQESGHKLPKDNIATSNNNIQHIRANLIRAVADLLDRLSNVNSSQSQTSEVLSREVDLIISRIFNCNTDNLNDNSSDDGSIQGASMEL